MTRHDDEEYLTTEEACAILGISRRTLERYVKDGRISRYRRGLNRVVFKRSEVESYALRRDDSATDDEQE